MSPITLTFASVLLVSIVSFVGVLFFLLSEKVVRASVLTLVGFSTGGLLGDVFIHMLPEMAEDAEMFPQALLVLLGGIIFSFVVEKLIHWRHCHLLPTDAHAHEECHPVGLMSLVGDGIHNFIDGLVIAGSFMVSVPVGAATTLAVIFHEIPQEVGDFAVLLHSGMNRRRALFMNFLSALAAVFGALVFFLAQSSFSGLEVMLLPFAAGNFLYIAGADLIPELHKETRLKQALVQLLAMLAGIGVMYGLLFLE